MLAIRGDDWQYTLSTLPEYTLLTLDKKGPYRLYLRLESATKKAKDQYSKVHELHEDIVRLLRRIISS